MRGSDGNSVETRGFILKPVEITGSMGEVTKQKVRNLFIFLGLGLLQIMVILEGLANYYSITVPLYPLQFILLGFVSVGLFFIAKF